MPDKQNYIMYNMYDREVPISYIYNMCIYILGVKIELPSQGSSARDNFVFV